MRTGILCQNRVSYYVLGGRQKADTFSLGGPSEESGSSGGDESDHSKHETGSVAAIY